MTVASDAISDLDRKRMEAMCRRDVATLDDILADDLVYTHASGKVDTKQGLIHAISIGKPAYLVIEPFDVMSRAFGDTVVLTGSARIDITSNGEPVHLDVRFSDVYVNQSGRWQMVNWHASRLPE